MCSISHKAMAPKVKKGKGKEKAATPKAKAKAADKNTGEVKAEEPATKKAKPSQVTAARRSLHCPETRSVASSQV